MEKLIPLCVWRRNDQEARQHLGKAKATAWCWCNIFNLFCVQSDADFNVRPAGTRERFTVYDLQRKVMLSYYCGVTWTLCVWNTCLNSYTLVVLLLLSLIDVQGEFLHPHTLLLFGLLLVEVICRQVGRQGHIQDLVLLTRNAYIGMTQHRGPITNRVSHMSNFGSNDFLNVTMDLISLEVKMYSVWFCFTSSKPNALPQQTHTGCFYSLQH